MFRDDVHRLAAVGDDAVNARGVAEMEPRRIDALEGLNDSGKRTGSVPWRRRSVRRLAVERQAQMPRRQCRNR